MSMLVDIMRTVLLIALCTMTLAFFVMACAVEYAPKHGETLLCEHVPPESET